MVACKNSCLKQHLSPEDAKPLREARCTVPLKSSRGTDPAPSFPSNLQKGVRSRLQGDLVHSQEITAEDRGFCKHRTCRTQTRVVKKRE